MNVDLKKAAGVNHARLTIDIDGLSNTIVFKSGGVADSPLAVTAVSSGGLVHEGLYESWLVEGEVTVSKDMAKYLIEAFKSRSNATHATAVYELYSTTDRMIIKHQFENVCVNKLPSLTYSEMGGEANMSISFSLADYVSTEVIDA